MKFNTFNYAKYAAIFVLLASCASRPASIRSDGAVGEISKNADDQAYNEMRAFQMLLQIKMYATSISNNLKLNNDQDLQIHFVEKYVVEISKAGRLQEYIRDLETTELTLRKIDNALRAQIIGY